MPKVSFVVPCYNSSATINRCVDSILLQSFSDIELIIIDDGSFDNTIDIIESYTKKDSRIKLIKQKHGGPNMAREVGIKKASGEYIMFVDSDDSIAKDAVEILINAIRTHEVDSVRFNGITTHNNKPVQPILNWGEKEKILKSDGIIELLLTTYTLNSLCLQIYKADKIKKVKSFHSDIVFGEDFLVNLEIHQDTDKMLVLGGEPLYFYYYNPNSTTRNMDIGRVKKNIFDRAYVSDRAIRFAQKNIKDNSLRNKIIYTQIKMIKGEILSLGKLDYYTKRQFFKDIHLILPRECFMNVNVGELRKYMKGLELKERLKNQRIILAILLYDYYYVWLYILIYRYFLRRIKK